MKDPFSSQSHRKAYCWGAGKFSPNQNRVEKAISGKPQCKMAYIMIKLPLYFDIKVMMFASFSTHYLIESKNGRTATFFYEIASFQDLLV